MSTRPNVSTIPPHRSFADALVAGLIATEGREPLGLARGVILLPNNRAVRAVTAAGAGGLRGGAYPSIPRAAWGYVRVSRTDRLCRSTPPQAYL